jgi:hypothetical protein
VSLPWYRACVEGAINVGAQCIATVASTC